MVLDYNPQDEIEPEQSLWLWGNDWLCNLDWDPKEWQWRRSGVLPETSILNYSTKRGYRIALKQNTEQMPLDAELEMEGFNSKARARFFNRIWHPFLPRKVSAMQWLVLTQGLPVGAWREKIGLPSDCELCPTPVKETLQHALKDCPQLNRAWELFRNTRIAAGLPPAYLTWSDISRGLMRDPPGPQVEEELRWDTASAFSLNSDTPWDVLRAQLLWSIWCQRVAHTFRNEKFHLGVVLWHAWRNTIYCAMEAYKELFRHKRNEEKRQELISCFQQIWTQENIFGRQQGSTIKWNITPHQEFLPRDLGAWTVPPIRIRRLSPSPDIEAEFMARPDFPNLVDDFLNSVGRSWQPSPDSPELRDHPESPNCHTPTQHTRSELNSQIGPSEPYTNERLSPEDSQPLSDYLNDARNDSSHTIRQGTYDAQTDRQTGPDNSSHSEEGTHQGDTPSQGASRHIDADSIPISLRGRQVADTKTEHTEAREEIILPNTMTNWKTHPRSRPKKRCSRRLQHPVHRSRRAQFSKDLNTNQALREPAHIHLSTDREPTSAGGTPLTAKKDERTKPTSRPKRKCRFGPRARRASNARHQKRAPRTTLPQPVTHPPGNTPQGASTPNQEETSSLGDLKPVPEVSSTQLPKVVPTERNHSQPLPDRVTLQPGDRVRRTPYDIYKGKRFQRERAGNSSKLAARTLGISEAEFGEILTNEINELLEEIENTRLETLGRKGTVTPSANYPRTPEDAKGRDDNPHLTRISEHQRSLPQTDTSQGEHLLKRSAQGTPSRSRIRSGKRIKEKCHFGPQSKRGRRKLRTSPPPRRDHPPPPPSCRTPPLCNDGKGPSLFGDGQGCPLFGEETCWRPRDADWIPSTSTHNWNPVQKLQEPEDGQVILPDRPTFMHFAPVRRSPFEKYLKKPCPADQPPPPPFRPVHARLGISEEEFEARLKEEIDEVLIAEAETRRQAREVDRAPPPPSPSPPLTVMTKADGLRFFRDREFPTTGSLLGVYWWAADLGWARFDYESEVNWDDLSYLDAYD